MALDSLDALSPIDGRYARSTLPLREHLSEAALIRQRIRIEAEWLLALAKRRPMGLAAAANVPASVLDVARQLSAAPPATAAAAVKAIEQRTNHDVKAVEYYVREQLSSAGASDAVLELVHFGCTSEDINNLAYARMLQGARVALLAELAAIGAALRQFADQHADLPMLARTHGQTASPTTLGKEFANVLARLERALSRWQQVPILGKWNGAVGNYNAHVVALPDNDWPAIGAAFVESLGLQANSLTTQIEPHDWIGEYCDALAAIDVVLIDFSRDVWGYISLGYLKQRAVAGEVGSSTMPHKVNPIDFENAEGNLGVANALLRHFAEKLPVSRWQRDLTDSTVLRNLGVGAAHSLIAYQAIEKGMKKLEADAWKLGRDLDDNWEVLGEAIQTVMRRYGLPEPYEQLKRLTRGQRVGRDDLRAFVLQLQIPEADKQRLLSMTPAAYVGNAAEQAKLRT